MATTAPASVASRARPARRSRTNARSDSSTHRPHTPANAPNITTWVTAAAANSAVATSRGADRPFAWTSTATGAARRISRTRFASYPTRILAVPGHTATAAARSGTVHPGSRKPIRTQAALARPNAAASAIGRTTSSAIGRIGRTEPRSPARAGTPGLVPS